MTDWSWPVGAPYDERRELPVFSLSPNWKSGVLETLSWLTDVLSSEQAVEMRRGVRRFPRRSFEANFLRQHTHRARLDNFLTGIGRGLLLMPMWHEQFNLKNGRTDGVVEFPKGTLLHREFRLGDLVLLNAGDPDKYAVLTVAEVTLSTDSIRLQAYDNVGLWPAGSRITPLRRARVLDAMSQSAPADRVGMSAIRFQLQDVDAGFTASWGYCAPLFRFKPNRAEPIEFTYDRSAYLQDFDTGVVDSVDPGNRAQITQSMKLNLFGRADISSFRAFLYAARGKAVRFYVPTFTADIHPLASLSGLVFDARMNGASEYVRVPQEARKMIGIVFSDGRPTIYRKIVNVEPVFGAIDQSAERYTLSAALPPIRLQDIDRVMYVVSSRFDMDTFELLHVTDNATAVKSAIVTRSSVSDQMPDIDCFVTSKPYPLYTVDSLMPTAQMVAGSLYESVIPVTESLDVSSRIIDPTLREVLKTYSQWAPEAAVVSSRLVSGTLRNVLLSYSAWPAEAMGANATLIAGTMRNALIVNTMLPEAVSASATITQGTLS